MILALGYPFLAYVGNTTPEAVEAHLDLGQRLPKPEMEDAVRDALTTAKILAAQRRPLTVNDKPGLEPLRGSLLRFGDLAAGHDLGAANLLRQRARGMLPQLEQGDPAKFSLQAAARDRYPTTLIAEGQDPELDIYGWRPDFFMPGHPGFEGFLEAVNKDDEPLRRLFPPESRVERTTTAAMVLSNSGTGGGLQPGTLSASILRNAEDRLLLAGHGFDAQVYVDEVARQVDEVRALAEGETVDVLTAVGLGGVQAYDGFRFSSPWGEVIQASEFHRRLPRIVRSFTGADLVLLSTYPLRVQIDHEFEPGTPPAPWPSDLQVAHDDLEKRIDRVRLTFMLGVERESEAALATLWRQVTDPMWGGRATFNTGGSVPSGATLAADDIPALTEWATRIKDRHHPSLDLAVRRASSSIALRYDPADSLVDAMIALENMFGTGQSEVGFRLSTALAWLFAEGAEERISEQDRFNKLYGLRSKILHGKDVPVADVERGRQEARTAAVRALRILYRDRPELLDEGDQRGKLVILGGIDDASDAETPEGQDGG